MLMSDSTPRPGWYADPENPASERWWNGSGWSEQQRPATVAAAPEPAAPVAPPAFPLAPPRAPASGSESATGFTFGVAVGAGGSRPDPYAPPAPNPALPYYGASTPYGAATTSTTNGLALAGLLVSSLGWIILQILGPIIGIVLSVVGLTQANKRAQQGLPNTGRGLAIAGIIVGGSLLVFGVLIYVLFFAAFAVSTSR